MKKISLQAIEDYYYRKGLRGSALRSATEKDMEYKRALRARWKKLSLKFPVKAADRERYVLSTDSDYEILGKIYRLERKRLSKIDKTFLKLVRTQLEPYWRAPILKFLDSLLNKYQ